MILVTGGTGLIGSHLLVELAKINDKIRATKRVNSNTMNVLKVFGYYADDARKLFNKIEWVDVDISDYLSLEKVFTDIDKVYHCAGLVSFERKNKYQLIDTNITGTSNLVNLSIEKKVNKFCFVSSIATFGEYDGIHEINESSRWKPGKKSSLYSLSKLKSEMEVWRGFAEGLNGIIVNPSVVIGPGFWNTGLGNMIRQISNGLKYYTKGITGYVDVRDVARIMVQLMESEAADDQFLISSENLSFKEIIDLIAEFIGCRKPTVYAGQRITSLGWKVERIRALLTGKLPTITRDSARIAHKRYLYSSKKVREKLSYNFIPIKDTLEFTVDKYLTEKKSQFKNI